MDIFDFTLLSINALATEVANIFGHDQFLFLMWYKSITFEVQRIP
jgi:hypothetical protein